LELVLTQIAELERERDAVVKTEASDKASKMIQQLAGLRGIGVQGATVLVREAFVRRFANGKDHTPVWPPRHLGAAGSTASRASERPAIGGSEE
jgi:hypothetical protein